LTAAPRLPPRQGFDEESDALPYEEEEREQHDLPPGRRPPHAMEVDEYESGSEADDPESDSEYAEVKEGESDDPMVLGTRYDASLYDSD